jgi:hypothetical protein
MPRSKKMADEKDEALGTAVTETADFDGDSGLTSEQRDDYLKIAASKHEIELEEPEDDETPEAGTPEPVAPKTPEPTAEPAEEMVEVEGVKVPLKVAEAIAKAVKETPEDDKPKEEKADQPDQTKELIEKLRKSAYGDEAMLGVIDLFDGLRKELSTRDQREANEKAEADRAKAHQQRLAEDRAEVEKEFGVKLSDEDMKALFATAKTLKWNPLKDAYAILNGKKGKAPDKDFRTVDSNKQERQDGLDPDTAKELTALSKKFGLSAERTKNVLKRAGAR